MVSSHFYTIQHSINHIFYLFLAFYGGRTNAVKLYQRVKRDENRAPLEHIRYVDVCSLYPYVNKYGVVPLGHPKILTENFEEISKSHRPYNGLLKVKILPPRKLLHPVLPYRSHGKLMFPLCKTCVELKFQDKCLHSQEERALTGEWVSLEIYKAVEKGYTILEIFEVWHYEKLEQYDPVTNPDGGLFTGYVNTFMKMKLV
jgi:hypothetical protein